MADTMQAPDLAGRLRQTWPTLTADQRQVILDLVWTLSGSESEMMAELEELEDELAFDARKNEGGTERPFDEVVAQIEAGR